VIRGVLPFALGVAILLVTVGFYRVLEALLVNIPDYDRGLWEGVVLVLVMNGGNAIATGILRRVNARKERT
jgi:hypothetical protein